MNAEIEAIKEVLSSVNMQPIVFVDEFSFTSDREKDMMEQAMHSIDECEILIAETSDKAIGVGIEAGYAKAKGKKIIYLRNKNAEHSTTISGISDWQVIYPDLIELKSLLKEILFKI